MRQNATEVAFTRTLRRVLGADVVPRVEEWEEARGGRSRELFGALGRRGLLGIEVSRELGGLGLGFSATRILATELGSLDCGGVGMAITTHTDMCLPAVVRYGTTDVVESYVAPAVRGESIGAIALTEPSSGSDYQALETSLRRTSEGWVLNGVKTYITNGSVADFVVVLARTSRSRVIGEAFSMVVVPTDAPGVRREALTEKLGNWSCDHGTLFFEGVHVPDSHVLGEPGLGYAIQAEQFIRERMVSAIVYTAQARRVLGRAVERARERSAFGSKLIDHGVIADRLTDLEIQLTLLDALIESCTHRFDSGDGELAKASLTAKVVAGRAWQEGADLLMQLYAGEGYLSDASVQRAYRDARASSIAGGAEGVLRRNLQGYLA